MLFILLFFHNLVIRKKRFAWFKYNLINIKKIMKKLLIISSIFLGGFLFAQNSVAKITLKQVQKEFKYKKYSIEILKKFISEIDEVEQEPNVWESIPGEIIGWENDRATYSIVETFWIKNNKLIQIETNPTIEQVNKYSPKNGHFEYIEGWQSIGKVLKKDKNGIFHLGLIMRFVKDVNSENFSDERFQLEYQTKDFKKFTLKRLKPTESKKWTIIK